MGAFVNITAIPENIFQEINTPQLFVFKSLASQQDRLLPYFNNNSIYFLIQMSSSRSKESQKSSIEHKTLLFMLSSYEFFFQGTSISQNGRIIFLESDQYEPMILKVTGDGKMIIGLLIVVL